mmetsp:Transcript_26080/g.64774  ORF Transcript_26080/g.64774 Transcript_26080/m.64774 type:complete len:240 (+) Transcript_26080:1183-1902(+)
MLASRIRTTCRMYTQHSIKRRLSCQHKELVAHVPHLLVPQAPHSVVVHHTYRLHERIHYLRSRILHSLLLERGAHLLADRRLARHLRQLLVSILDRLVADKAPQVGRQAPMLLLDALSRLGVGHKGIQLGPAADNGRVLEGRFDFSAGHGCHLVDVEGVKAGAEGISLLEDGQPAETSLGPFQAHHLKEMLIVPRGHSPLLIVIGIVQSIIASQPVTSPPAVFRAICTSCCRPAFRRLC